jgi:putative ABC transport system permease protein
MPPPAIPPESDPPPDWPGLVVRHARTAGVDLTPLVVDELATHLEDIYLAARADGADHHRAMDAARHALETSGLATVRLPRRPDSRAIHARLADDAASASRTRSFAMGYALRMALRQFRLQPAFALVVALVLGLGTGAATVVYTVVDAVVLRPLPYRAPDRLVKLWDANTEKGLARDPFSPVTFMDYRALPVFGDAAAWWRPDVNLRDPGLEPARVRAIETSANLFEVLGVGPQLGAGFPKDGPLFSPEPIAVISDRLWRTRYNADPSLIGRTLRLNDVPYTIAGIMPAGFHFPDDVDVWERLQWDLTPRSRHARFMEGVARLKDGTSIEEARAAADALAARLAREHEASNKGWALALLPLLHDQLGYYRPALYVLFGAVGLLFVIGCLNVASLLLTRTLSRQREIAVRTALGAAPRQIVAQLLAESLLLSVAGSVVGIAVALAALPLVVALTPVAVPRLADASVSVGALGVALGLLVVTTVAFGLVPALVLVRRHAGRDLKAGGRGSSRDGRLIYQGLVVAEVGLAGALLVGSALLVRTVGRMTQIPIGVDGGNVVLANVQLAIGPSQGRWQRVATEHATILDRIREQPGVTSAGSTNILPLEPGWRGAFRHADQPPASLDERPRVQYISVSDGWFETMGVAVREGRAFSAQDTPQTEAVAIVNETLAKRYFAGRSAVGGRLPEVPAQIGPVGLNLKWTFHSHVDRTPPEGGWRVVGVVADVQNQALGLPVEPAVYLSTRQFPFAAVSIAVAGRDHATAVAAVRNAVKQVSPETPVGTVDTWPAHLAARTAEPRLLMTTLTTFGVLAAALAALGVYGLFSWSVALRRRELAIRLTLGARPTSVGAGLMRHSARLVAIGLGLGLGLVQSARGLLNAVLFGITTHDPASIAAAGALLFVVAIVASVPPAWRAMRVDPVEGLRAE